MLTGLRLENLALSRGDLPLFQGLKLELSAGQALALTGPNGAGKTSLLRSLAGFIRPDAGRITPLGSQGHPVELEVFRARHLHWLGHQEGLKPTRTVAAELGFICRYLGGTDQAMEEAVRRLALGPLLDLECRKLSAGQRRRVSLARLIAAPRSLWLLDEPLAPLDEDWRGQVADLIGGHLAAGGMVIAAVHDPLPHASQTLDLGGRA